jgi:hypothetical protein
MTRSKRRRTWLYATAVVSGALVAIATGASEGAETTPAQLRGKSVQLSWREIMTTQDSNGPVFRGGDDAGLIIYISDLGRLFIRRQVHGDGQPETRSVDRVGSSDGRGGSGLHPFQNVHFEGMTLVAMRRTSAGSATRIEAAFDGAFSSCSLTVRHGGDVQGTPKTYSFVSPAGRGFGRKILAVETSGAQCSIKAGNVFQ